MKLTAICKASNPSYEETSTVTLPSSGLSKKLSLSYLRMSLPPTVIHRSQHKLRHSLLSVDKGAGVVEVVPDISPSTSAEISVNSGKSSNPETENHSTGKTSQDSKFSQMAKKMSGRSQRSSEGKKTAVKQAAEEVSMEAPLKPIIEIEAVEIAPEPTPSKAAE
jgi:hypothetical protein